MKVVLILPVACALVSCVNADMTVKRASSRDSSGIAIVETTPSEWPPAEAWRIVATPTVDIGIAGGDSLYELHQVQGAIGLEDGSIVVAEFAARLRFYDAKGTHLRSIEMQGEGPGEAELFSGFDRYRGDSLRISTERSLSDRGDHEEFLILDRSGRFGRQLSIDYSGRGIPADSVIWFSATDGGIQATLDDGSFLASGAGRLVVRNPGDLIYARSGVMRIDGDGRLVDTVATINTDIWEYDPKQLARYQFVVGSADRVPLRARGNTLYHTAGERLEVDIFEPAPQGTSTEREPSMRKSRSFRVEIPLISHTTETKKTYIDNTMAIFRPQANDAEKSAYRARRDSMKTPPFVPAVQDLRVDAIGNVWLELYISPGFLARQAARSGSMEFEKEPSRWIVLSPEGSLVGSVMVPMNFQIFDIGNDYVIGLWRDQLGVEHIRKHPIVKQGG